jgi:anaerobic ribonucleoside-triphosphate reductase activating protein
MFINIHHIISLTEVNGPGKRFGIWFQGCNINCNGCFNPETHYLNTGKRIQPVELLEEITAHKNIEGISISGGEPFLQAEGLLELLKLIKNKTGLSVLVFTGFTYEKLKDKRTTNEAITYIDLLIAGPYMAHLKTNIPLLASSNQTIHFITQRYKPYDLKIYDVEIIIEKNGLTTITGKTAL